MRWSASSEKNAVSPWRNQAPPPYSWTRVRTFTPGGVTSSPAWTRVVRPSSLGLRSSHQADPSSPNQGSEWRTPAAAVIAAERGDGQEPYGAVGIPHHRPVIRTAAYLAL